MICYNNSFGLAKQSESSCEAVHKVRIEKTTWGLKINLERFLEQRIFFCNLAINLRMYFLPLDEHYHFVHVVFFCSLLKNDFVYG